MPAIERRSQAIVMFPPSRFLGKAAGFPQGPYILGALLDCPVYALFCLREGGRYRVDAFKLADRIVLPAWRPRRGFAELLRSVRAPCSKTTP